MYVKPGQGQPTGGYIGCIADALESASADPAARAEASAIADGVAGGLESDMGVGLYA